MPASHGHFRVLAVTSKIPTNCAPTAAQNNTSFVVSPRNSDGSVTSADTRKRFYVVVTGDQGG